jgi:hypothetical protein
MMTGRRDILLWRWGCWSREGRDVDGDGDWGLSSRVVQVDVYVTFAVAEEAGGPKNV